MDFSFLDDILSNLGKEESPELNPRDILIVDATNLFIRSYSVSTHINRLGEHVGGLVGFLKSLGFIVRNLKPKKIILVFDGDGNSINKKYIYPQYKANRGTKVINYKVHTSKEEEEESMDNQLGRLVRYLKQLPVSLVSISNHEADDVIGYLANHFKISDNVIVVSTDRDYYQIIDENVKIYDPRNKIFINETYVLENYGVTPKNFLTLKVLIGDKSDNVPGVQGVQEKTAVKLFPELGSDQIVELKDIYNLSQERLEKNKIYSRILGYKYQLEINYKLMNLKKPNIGESYLNEIMEFVENTYTSNRANVRILMEADRISESFGESWLFDSFSYLHK